MTPGTRPLPVAGNQRTPLARNRGGRAESHAPGRTCWSVVPLFLPDLLGEVPGSRFVSLVARIPSQDGTSFWLVLVAWVMAIAAVAGASWLAATVYQRWESQSVQGPSRLFSELCRAHGLSRSQRHLIQELAEWHGLADPVQLFVEPEWWQFSQPGGLWDGIAAVAELRAQLFAEDERSEQNTGEPTQIAEPATLPPG